MKFNQILAIVFAIFLTSSVSFASTHVFECYSEEDSTLWTLKYDETNPTGNLYISDLSRVDSNGDYVTLFSRIVPTDKIYFETLDTKDPDGNPELSFVIFDNGHAGYFEASHMESNDDENPKSYFVTMDPTGTMGSIDAVCSYTLSK